MNKEEKIIKNQNIIISKIDQMNELYQKTFSALIQSHPDAERIQQALKEALPKPSSRVSFSEEEQDQLSMVIRNQQAKGIDSTYLEKLLTYDTISQNQYDKAIITIKEWLSPVGPLPSRPTETAKDRPFVLTSAERSRLERIDIAQKANGMTSDFLENKLKQSNYTAKEYTRLVDTLNDPKKAHIQ